MKFFIKQNPFKIFWLVALVLSLSLVYCQPTQAAWQEPGDDPPNSNRPEPLDISATAQTKAGDLEIQGTLTASKIQGPTIIESTLTTLIVKTTGLTNNDIALSVIAPAGAWAGYFTGAVGIDGSLQVGTGSGELCLNGQIDCISSWSELNASPGGVDTNVQFNNAGSLGGDNGFVYTGSRVGIGTATPAEELHVYGSAGPIRLKIESTNNQAGVQLNNNLGQAFFYLDTTDGDFQVISNENVILRSSGGGNVGVGTEDPVYPLDVLDDNSTAIIDINNVGTDLWTGTRLAREGTEKWFIGMDNADDNLRIRSDGATDDVVITPEGRLAVGFSASAALPQARFEVRETNDLGGDEGDYQLISTIGGETANFVANKTWLYRDVDDPTPDWLSTRIFEGITVDGAWPIPHASGGPRTWRERDPQAREFSWGSEDNTYMTLTNGRLLVNNSAGHGGNFEVSNNENDDYFSVQSGGSVGILMRSGTTENTTYIDFANHATGVDARFWLTEDDKMEFLWSGLAIGLPADPSPSDPSGGYVQGLLNTQQLCINGDCKSSWAEVSGSNFWTDQTAYIEATNNPDVRIYDTGSDAFWVNSLIRGDHLWVTNTSPAGYTDMGDAYFAGNVGIAGNSNAVPSEDAGLSVSVDSGSAIYAVTTANAGYGGAPNGVSTYAGVHGVGGTASVGWNLGVYGVAGISSGVGTTAGVYGRTSDSSNSYAGYFDGKTLVDGMLLTGSPSLILPDTTDNLIYGNIDTNSVGSLLLLQNESTDRFRVDKDGNVSSAGSIYSGGNISADGNLTLNNGADRIISVYQDSGDGYDLQISAGGSYCFSGETKINTPFGLIMIKDLEIGNEVFGYDIEADKMVIVKVLDLYSRKADSFYILNNNIQVTPEHPFYTSNGWKKVKDLIIGDELFTVNGWLELSSKEKVQEELLVYNLQVESPNTYFAEGVLVHNKFPSNYDGGNVYLDGGFPQASGAYGDVLLANSGGDVGIGLSNPSAKLHVGGDVKIFGGVSIDNDSSVNNSADGDLTIWDGLLKVCDADNCANSLATTDGDLYVEDDVEIGNDLTLTSGDLTLTSGNVDLNNGILKICNITGCNNTITGNTTGELYVQNDAEFDAGICIEGGDTCTDPLDGNLEVEDGSVCIGSAGCDPISGEGHLLIEGDLEIGTGDVANIKKSDGDTVIEFNNGNVIIHLGL